MHTVTAQPGEPQDRRADDQARLAQVQADAYAAARLARLRALTPEQKHRLLCFIDGFAPDAIDAALATQVPDAPVLTGPAEAATDGAR
jgi:hypothetical protein